MTLRDANGSTGGLVVVPGSHREHQDLCQRSAWVLKQKNTDAPIKRSRDFLQRHFFFKDSSYIKIGGVLLFNGG